MINMTTETTAITRARRLRNALLLSMVHVHRDTWRTLDKELFLRGGSIVVGIDVNDINAREPAALYLVSDEGPYYLGEEALIIARLRQAMKVCSVLQRIDQLDWQPLKDALGGEEDGL